MNKEIPWAVGLYQLALSAIGAGWSIVAVLHGQTLTAFGIFGISLGCGLAGALLILRKRSGVTLTVIMQGLQIPIFSLWYFLYEFRIGPNLDVRLWPPIGFSIGFSFKLTAFWIAETLPFSFTINIVPGLIAALFLRPDGTLKEISSRRE